MKYASIPPPGGPILVPMSSKRAFRAGLLLWAPCRRASSLAQWFMWNVVSAGTAIAPTRRTGIELGTLVSGWEGMAARLSMEVGKFDNVAVYRPSQEGRMTLALLLIRSDEPIAFVKMGPTQVDDVTQQLVLMTVGQSSQFWSPPLLAAGTEGPWSFLAMGSMPVVRHRPGFDVTLSPITNDIEQLLADVLPSQGVPPHWRPMHGDLGPWNLRMIRGLGPAIVDWEHAAWGPPGADQAFFLAACNATGRTVKSSIVPNEEALEFWQKELATRFGPDRRDQALASGMLGWLRVMNRLGNS